YRVALPRVAVAGGQLALGARVARGGRRLGAEVVAEEEVVGREAAARLHHVEVVVVRPLGEVVAAGDAVLAAVRVAEALERRDRRRRQRDRPGGDEDVDARLGGEPGHGRGADVLDPRHVAAGRQPAEGGDEPGALDGAAPGPGGVGGGDTHGGGRRRRPCN